MAIAALSVLGYQAQRTSLKRAHLSAATTQAATVPTSKIPAGMSAALAIGTAVLVAFGCTAFGCTTPTGTKTPIGQGGDAFLHCEKVNLSQDVGGSSLLATVANDLVIPDLRNPIRLIVDNKDDLKLSATQLQRVDSIKGALDRQNDTLIAQVRRGLGEDSAMAGGGSGGDRRDGGEANNPSEAADRRAARATVLRDRLKVLQPTFEQIKKNDDEAWKAATAALEKDQRKKADRIRKDDQKAYGQSHSPFGEGWPGRRGGGDDND